MDNEVKKLYEDMSNLLKKYANKGIVTNGDLTISVFEPEQIADVEYSFSDRTEKNIGGVLTYIDKKTITTSYKTLDDMQKIEKRNVGKFHIDPPSAKKIPQAFKDQIKKVHERTAGSQLETY